MEPASSDAAVENSRTLWVGSLPLHIDERFLHHIFAPTRELVSARVMRERQTGVSQGFAFLEFSSHAAAQQVLNAFDGRQIPTTNHVFRLNWAAYGLGRGSEGGDGAESHSLFVGDLALDVTDLLLQKSFQQFFPTVSSAKVITERSTGRSKGYGFVRFATADERDKALHCMDGHLISGRPIRVSQATAKKYQGDGVFHPSDMDPSNTTAFVGNVNSDVTEDDLHQLFRRCGEIVSIKLLRAKGCAFVTYAERTSAERAIVELHGKVIKNCAIRLCWGRRSSQSRAHAHDLGAPLSVPVGPSDYRAQIQPGYELAHYHPLAAPLGLYGAQGMGPMGLLPGMPALPQPGIFDAALHAASLSAPPSLATRQQVAMLPHFAPQPQRPSLPALRPPSSQTMPATLQALAGLSLGQSSVSEPLL